MFLFLSPLFSMFRFVFCFELSLLASPSVLVFICILELLVHKFSFFKVLDSHSYNEQYFDKMRPDSLVCFVVFL